ncbi:hypothetical protein ABZ897_03990 [Nonomuraea sp. NPDC046802]|uniref:hypothetical protein n=1 Tax=Nonomuraea sp. NPDC046802 TaxID=3154919 RepID=UPI00340A59D8
MAGRGTHTATWIAAWVGGGCTLIAALIGAYATLAAQEQGAAKPAPTVTVTRHATDGAAPPQQEQPAGGGANRPVAWKGRVQQTFDGIDYDQIPPSKVGRYDGSKDFTMTGYAVTRLYPHVETYATWEDKKAPSSSDCEQRLRLHELLGNPPVHVGAGLCFRTEEDEGGTLGFLRLVSTKDAGNVGMQIDAVIWEH